MFVRHVVLFSCSMMNICCACENVLPLDNGREILYLDIEFALTTRYRAEQLIDRPARYAVSLSSGKLD